MATIETFQTMPTDELVRQLKLCLKDYEEMLEGCIDKANTAISPRTRTLAIEGIGLYGGRVIEIRNALQMEAEVVS